MDKSFRYFAYGSNMSLHRLTERCPSAEMLFCVELRGYEFQMTRKRNNGYGAADIVKDSESSTIEHRVYGVVYRILDKEKNKLRKAEGWREGNTGAYLEEVVDVVNCTTGKQHKNIVTYVVREKQTPPVPTTRGYREYVLGGAKAWQLPAWYIEELMRKIEIVEDAE